MDFSPVLDDWASEANPTLRSSIKISRDMYVCLGAKGIGGITWPKYAHAQSQFGTVKRDL